MWPPNPSLQQQCVQRQDQKVREKTAFVGCQITQDDGSRDSWRRVERGESGGMDKQGLGQKDLACHAKLPKLEPLEDF